MNLIRKCFLIPFLVGALLIPQTGFAAIPSTAIWRVSTLGANTNGGAFDTTGWNLVSGTYTSGITAVGSNTQTCVLSAFNGGGYIGTVTVALTGTNTIAGGTSLVIAGTSGGFATAPTSATATTGTATSCLGTAVISTVIGVASKDMSPFPSNNTGGCSAGTTCYSSTANLSSTGATTAGTTTLTCSGCSFTTAIGKNMVYVAGATNTGLASGTYTSGITTTGTTGQTCVLLGFNDSGVQIIATVALTSTNTIAATTALVVVLAGSGLTTGPTTATAYPGTAAACSGTATIVGVTGNSAAWYEATYASATTITLDRSVPTASGVTINIGGALADINTPSEGPALASNIIAVKADGTQATTTGTASSGATSIAVASGTGIAVNQLITGTGIMPGTYVSNVSGTTVTLPSTFPTIAALSSTALTFTTPYTVASNIIMNQNTSGGTGYTTIEGYSSTLGDFGLVPLVITAPLSGIFTGIANDQARGIFNFQINCNSQAGTVRGINTPAYVQMDNSVIVNCATVGIAGPTLAISRSRVSGGLSGCTAGVSGTTGNTKLSTSLIDSNLCPGVSPGASFICDSSVSALNTGSSSDGYTIGVVFSGQVASMENCGAYGNGRYGVNISGTTGSQVMSFHNNWSWGNTLRDWVDSSTQNGFGQLQASGYNAYGTWVGFAYPSPNDIILTADPTVAGTSFNFALNSAAGGGALLKGAGSPGALFGSLGYLDIGPLQHQATSGGQVAYPIQ